MKKNGKRFIFLGLLVSLFANNGNLIYADDSEKIKTKKNEKPSFENFPVKTSQVGSIPKLRLTTRLARQYKTTISTEATKPSNFAGEFRVATWGCGTDCRGFAIISKHTGVVYTLPGVEYIAGVMGNDDERIAFKLDSRLLIITGSMNDNSKDEGTFYYEWTGRNLKLLAKLPIEKENILP